MIKYPKLLLFVACIALAYVLYQLGVFDVLETALNGHGYFSVLLGGLLFSTGFTTPFAIAIFIAAAPDVHPLLASMIAGLGALISDMSILRCAKLGFGDELRQLGQQGWMQRMRAVFTRVTLTERIRRYLMWSIAGLIIASPLPDEVGMPLLSGITTINEKKLGILCFVLNTIGIFCIFWIARLV